MPQCITANKTLDVTTLDESAGVVYPVRVHAAAAIRITFTPPVSGTVRGTVTVVSVSPPGPNYGSDWVEFTTDNLGQEYTVQVSFTEPPKQDDGWPKPLETPSKSPKFKPLTTCPPSAQ
ncbi:hypothetical protein SAMN02745121_07560 [Nannocystis exedens]|uniref:Uncharacterized protein n=1 Tax=Nannocystis exedens TaxID=54 RepID=A0A1I2GY97_9BACT|nr:hypothetical protein [Nannocystis exedens]PCC74041.1 hypothetical protein NAEX_07130 [Nannocystis exedens]SFF21566.1 hypothetical protein SAMN02745121_07560 [Nannocystis exedens]